MPEVYSLAQFAHDARFTALSADSLEQLKIRVLDTIGVAIAARDAEPIRAIRGLLADLGGTPQATYIGGGAGPLDRVAFYNTALSRYLDFMDSFLAPGETNHPSDNLGAVLAASESVDGSGREFLTALAVSYQVHARLSEAAPVRARGFDHTVQGAYAAAAGVSRALGLSVEHTAQALAISGTANNALRVTRTGNLSHWKGLAYPNVAKEATFAALLARAGITGPELVFEGNKGFRETIAGPFELDWAAEGLDVVPRTLVKRHNAEIHSQTAIEAALDIRSQDGFLARAITGVHLRTFAVAHAIIGGGEEGSKQNIRSKEEADHSLPYLLAAALLDGAVQPAQFTPERILSDDIQDLLALITVEADAALSARFPAEMPAELRVTFADGSVLEASESSYLGFPSDPLDWDGALEKFRSLAQPGLGIDPADRLAELIHSLETRPVRELTTALSRVGGAEQDRS